MTTPPATRACIRCHGSGQEPDPKALGEAMRAKRERTGKSLRAVAEKMKISAPYLSDLERGNRLFSPEHVVRFEAALKC